MLKYDQNMISLKIPSTTYGPWILCFEYENNIVDLKSSSGSELAIEC